MADVVWLSRAALLAIHRAQLLEHGGPPGVRDNDALTAAMGRPQHQYTYLDSTPDIAALAASYAFGLSQNHPFADGNKRTAYIACRAFLLLNGVDFDCDPAERYKTFLDLAAGGINENQLTAWIRDRTCAV